MWCGVGLHFPCVTLSQQSVTSGGGGGVTAPRLVGGGVRPFANNQTITPFTIANMGDPGTYSVQSGTMPTGLSLNTSTGEISGTVGGAVTTGNHALTIRCTNGAGTSDSALTIRIHATKTDINQAWVTTNAGSGGIVTLNTANRLYLLTEDITFSKGGFIVLADGVSIDGDGHTLTYGNETPITVTNYSFESGTGTTPDGWNMTSASEFTRAAGTFTSNHIKDGSYGLRIATPCANKEIVCNDTITLAANTKYFLAAHFYYSRSDNPNSVGVYVKLVPTGAGSTRQATANSTFYGGMQYTRTSFTTGGTAETYNVYVGVTGAGSEPSGTLYVDRIRVAQGNIYAITQGIPASLTKHPYYSGGGSDAAATLTLANLDITHGTEQLIQSHGIYTANGTGLSVTNCTVSVNADESKCIHTDYVSSLTLVGSTIEHTTTVGYDRHQFDAYSVIAHSCTATVTDNTFSGSPQGGIMLSDAGGEISYNTMSMNGLYTNGFCIGSYGLKASNIHHNTINTSTTGTSGRGIALGSDGAGLPTTAVTCYSNTITGRELSQNQEYGGAVTYGWYGIQIEGRANCEVYDNTITGYADQADVSCIRHNGDTGLTSNIHDNILTAVQQNTARIAACYSPDHHDTSTDAIFADNTCISNNAILGKLNDVQECTLTRPVITQSGTVTDWIMGEVVIAPVTGIVVVDPVFADAASETAFEAGELDISGSPSTTSSWSQAWTHTLQVRDSTTAVVASASVSVTDASGTEVATGTTDVDGELALQLNEFTITGATKSVTAPFLVKVTKASNTTAVVSLTGTSSNHNLAATIDSVGTAPIIDAISNVTAYEDVTAVSVTPNNSGGTVTAWSCSSTLPTGVSFSTSTGAFTGTPTDSGVYPIVVTATGPGGTTQQRFHLTVLAAVVYDSFTGTNGTALTSHTADSGHAWSSFGGNIEINTNKARISGSETNSTNFVNSGRSQGRIIATFTIGVTSGSDVVGIFCRYTNSGSNYWLIFLSRTADLIVCRKFVNGTSTDVAQTALTVDDGQTYTLVVDLTATGITASVGATSVTANDTAHSTATRHGLWFFNSGTVTTKSTADEFRVFGTS